MRLHGLMRWMGSVLMGSAIVYLLLVAGLYVAGRFEEAPAERPRAQAIDLLAEIERVRLQEELGLSERRPGPPPPPPVVMPRQVSGFVQLEVEVGAGGEVLEARVLGAVPEGYYEAQALEEVRQRKYEPAPIGRYRQTEVVPFTVTVTTPDASPEG